MTNESVKQVKAEPLALSGMTNDQLELVRRTVASGATDDELALYIHECQRRNAHPLDRLIHFTKRKSKDGTSRVVFITSIDLFRSQASDTGDHAGTDDVVFEEGKFFPAKATVTVYRIVKGLRCAYTATARWAEYYPGDGEAGYMWRKMPHVLLGKCAEALSLRKAFPRQLANLHTEEEMYQGEAEPLMASTGGAHEALLAAAAAVAAKSLPAASGVPMPQVVVPASVAQVVGPPPAPSRPIGAPVAQVAPLGQADPDIEFDPAGEEGLPDSQRPKRPPPDPNRTVESTLDAAGLGVGGPSLPSQGPKQGAVGANAAPVAPGAYLAAFNAMRGVAEGACVDAKVPPAVLERKWAEFIGHGESGVASAEAWIRSLMAGAGKGGEGQAQASSALAAAPEGKEGEILTGPVDKVWEPSEQGKISFVLAAPHKNAKSYKNKPQIGCHMSVTAETEDATRAKLLAALNAQVDVTVRGTWYTSKKGSVSFIVHEVA